MQAPSTAPASVTGKPSAVPNSSPLAPASSGPGNISGVSSEETATNASGAAGPIPSTQPRTSPTQPRTAPGVGRTTSSTTAIATATPRPSAARRRRAARLSGAPEGGLCTPQLGDGLLVVHPLARDAVEVPPRPQLGEHGEREHLDAAAEQVVGGQRLVAHLPEVRGAGVGHVDHHLGGDLRLELDLLVEHVPPGRIQELGEQLVGAEAVGLLEEAGLGPDLLEPLAVALVAGALALELDLDQLLRHHLEQPEVQERDLAVGLQQEVAGVRVAGELAVAVHA